MVNKVFPAQKLSYSKKTTKWAEECVEGAFDLACNNTPNIRQDYLNKKKNYDLYNLSLIHI